MRGKISREITWAVGENGCWNCTSHAPNSEGYPRININHKRLYLSRYMYQKHKDQIPAGYDMCHKCDNPLCINPEHLFVGTRKDNIDDCINKGRNVRGEKCNFAKLTEEQAREIKFGYRHLMYKEIAAIYSVAPSLISLIKNNKRWGYLQNE